jgi:hypothetical protein
MERFTLQGERLPLKVALAESEPSREAEQSQEQHPLSLPQEA